MSILEHVDSPREYVEELCAQDPIEGKWLQGMIGDFWDSTEPYEYECVDNTRLACGSSEAELDAYEVLVQSGCCGFVDMRFGPSPNGNSYRYGFNHGH
jgi:hypothetical protein